ncbi:hypothetical protein SH2C18_47200 [Clostridium sediminicola]|uniref:DUF2812 domain-containing protein n=1 Tax=Clostridium sediminicola TaxID=3114879 RepID=UPI0031F2366A
MKNNTKKVIKFTSITEYKTLEEYLEKMAAKGFMLSEIKRGKFIFTKIEPRELTFNVSLFYHTTPFDYPNHEKDKDYKELCEESGWTYCTNTDVYQIFYKEKNNNATPIHTDSEEEYKIIKNTFMKTDFISMILLTFVVGMQFINTLNFNYEYLLNNTFLLTLIGPIFLILIMSSIYIPPIVWLIKNKINLTRGKELEFSTNKERIIRSIITWSLISLYFILTIFTITDMFTNSSILVIAFAPILISFIIATYCIKRFKTKKNTRKHNIIFFSIILTLTLVIVNGIIMSFLFSNISKDFKENHNKPKNITVLELSDFGTNDTPERTRIHEQSSILIPISFDYYESLGRKAKDTEIMSVSTEYIECKNKDIADYYFDGFMDKKRKRLEETISEYLEFGDKAKAEEYKNDISEISDLWNVNRGYYLYSSKSAIILQKNNLIYILDGDIDFSKKEIIDICKQKLGL